MSFKTIRKADLLYCQYRIKQLLQIRLKDVLEAYHRRTGERITYATLSARTGLSVPTIESLATRPGYNTRLSTIEKLCRELGCQPGDLLEYRQ